jgi:hypothetical protein
MVSGLHGMPSVLPSKKESAGFAAARKNNFPRDSPWITIMGINMSRSRQ